MVYTRRPVSERFWEKVEKTESCWFWRAGPHKDDLNIPGKFQLGRGIGLIRAHHYAWIESGRTPPRPPYFLCHTCDTPKCVRPDHLFLGTAADNNADRVRKGRSYRPTHCRQGHAQVDHGYITKGGHPRCHTCVLEQRRERYRAKGI